MNESELIDRIASEVVRRLQGALPTQSGAHTTGFPQMTPADVAKYIDHTLLMPDAADGAFDKLCDEGRVTRPA